MHGQENGLQEEEAAHKLDASSFRFEHFFRYHSCQLLKEYISVGGAQSSSMAFQVGARLHYVQAKREQCPVGRAHANRASLGARLANKQLKEYISLGPHFS